MISNNKYNMYASLRQLIFSFSQNGYGVYVPTSKVYVEADFDSANV